MSFSYAMLDRGLTKAAGKVNEMVLDFTALKLTGYSKTKRRVFQCGRAILPRLSGSNCSVM